MGILKKKHCVLHNVISCITLRPCMLTHTSGQHFDSLVMLAHFPLEGALYSSEKRNIHPKNPYPYRSLVGICTQPSYFTIWCLQLPGHSLGGSSCRVLHKNLSLLALYGGTSLSFTGRPIRWLLHFIHPFKRIVCNAMMWDR